MVQNLVVILLFPVLAMLFNTAKLLELESDLVWFVKNSLENVNCHLRVFRLFILQPLTHLFTLFIFMLLYILSQFSYGKLLYVCLVCFGRTEMYLNRLSTY